MALSRALLGFPDREGGRCVKFWLMGDRAFKLGWWLKVEATNTMQDPTKCSFKGDLQGVSFLRNLFFHKRPSLLGDGHAQAQNPLLERGLRVEAAQLRAKKGGGRLRSRFL